MNRDAARIVVSRARAAGRSSLLEHEGYELLAAAGLDCPAHAFVPPGQQVGAADLAGLRGDRLVVKAVAPGLLHKTEVGGVAIGPRSSDWATATAATIRARLGASVPSGILLVEYTEHDASPGGELLASARATAEFGPVATLALGGVHAEFLSAHLREEAAMAAVRPGGGAAAGVDRAAVVQLLTAPMRGSAARLPREALDAWLGLLLDLAEALPDLGILECEMNPVVVANGRLVALDALVTLGHGPYAAKPRPLDKLGTLLHPRRIAIVGVSDQVNPGRIILRNMLREGTAADAITVVKPGRSDVDGCRAVPSLGDLPSPVDLLVVAVGAAQAPGIIEQAIDRELAESIILIPGGFEEKDGSAPLAARIRAKLDASRAMPWRGPLVVGGNCLGVRSRPGRYDTMFIPEHKLPAPPGPPDRIAVISQSGAFAIARVSRWAPLTPRYVLTTGNQADVTIGDLLTGLADDPGIDVFAVYVEGFRPGDGAQTLDAAARIHARGGSVVLYRAGRTAAGARASASHTASIAGDARLTRALFTDAGTMVAETVDAFDDLVLLAARMGARRPAGLRLAAMSNAGFECVAIADWLGGLTLASWTPQTSRAVSDVLARLRVSEVVDVHNPLDLTPMTNDAGYEAIARAVLSDPGVDLAVVGCVPLTAALHTVPAAAGIPDDLAASDGVVARLGRLWREGGVPWVAVVDAGARFDPMAVALAEWGVPVFRSADRALRALDAWSASVSTKRC